MRRPPASSRARRVPRRAVSPTSTSGGYAARRATKGRAGALPAPNHMQRCVGERQDLSTAGTRWPRTRRLSRRIRSPSSALLMFEPCHVLLHCLDCSRGNCRTHLVELPAPVHRQGNAHDHPHQGGAECRGPVRHFAVESQVGFLTFTHDPPLELVDQPSSVAAAPGAQLRQARRGAARGCALPLH